MHRNLLQTERRQESNLILWIPVHYSYPLCYGACYGQTKNPKTLP